MQLNYTITQEHYEDVIAFQLKLQRSKRRSLIQYIVTNAIFIILAVYFLVTHPESSVWSRLGVMGMAAAMLVLTTDRRSCSPGKVRRTYKRYVRLKLIQDGFIGPHTLLVDKNSVTQKFGNQSNTIEIKRCAWVNGENRISMILGGGCWLRLGRKRIGTLIDLSGLGLDQIEEQDGWVRIGAMVSLRQLETSALLKERFGSLFADMTGHIVGVQFRNLATVGGSIFGYSHRAPGAGL